MPNLVIGIIFFVIGFLLAYIGFILGLIDAFKEDVAWGVVYWLVPLASLVFYLKKWSNKKIRKSFFVMVAGWLMTSLGGGLLQQASSSFQTSTTFGADITSSQNSSEESPSDFPTELNVSPSPTPASSPGSEPSDFPTELNVSPSPTQASSPGFEPSPQISPASVPAQENDFKQSMKLGYTYYEQGDYQTALINFNRALQIRPGDAYAVKAVDNTKSAIAQAKTK